MFKSSFYTNTEKDEIFCRPQCSTVQREKCQPSCKPVYWCKKCSSDILYNNNSPSSQTGFPSSQAGLPFSQTGLPTSQASYPSSQTGFPSSQVGFSSSQTGLPSGRDYFSASSITTSKVQTEAISVYSSEDYLSPNADVNTTNENFSSQSLSNPSTGSTGEKPESYGNILIPETLPSQTYPSSEYSSSPGLTSSQSFSDPSSSQSISNSGLLSSQSYSSPNTSSNQESPSPGLKSHSDSRSSQSYQSAITDSPSHDSRAINIPVMVTGTYSGPAQNQQAEFLAGYSNQSGDKARYTLPSLELPASGEDPYSEPDQNGDEVFRSKPERNAFLSEDNSQGIVSNPAPGLDTSSLVPPLSFQIDWQPFLPEGIAIPAFNGIADRLPGWDRPNPKSLENSFEKQSTAADSLNASDDTEKGEETVKNLSETVPAPTIGKKEQEFVGGDRQPPIIVVAVASPTDSLRDEIDESLSANSESEDNNGGRDKFLLLASSSEVRGSTSSGFPATWVPRGDINDVINTIPESQVLEYIMKERMKLVNQFFLFISFPNFNSHIEKACSVNYGAKTDRFVTFVSLKG